jgi:hypothetical protein
MSGFVLVDLTVPILNLLSSFKIEYSVRILLPDLFFFYYAKHNISFLILFLCFMRKLLLLLVTLITFTNVSYASFPVNQNTQTEIVETIESPSYGNSQPNWDQIFQILGWLSLTLSVVFFIYTLGALSQVIPEIVEDVFYFLLYGAIILGIPGLFKKRSRKLSIISLSLLILSFLIVVINLMILVSKNPPWTW